LVFGRKLAIEFANKIGAKKIIPFSCHPAWFGLNLWLKFSVFEKKFLTAGQRELWRLDKF
jgi:hypothetical protein